MDVWKTLRYVHATEKSIALIERENKIVFIVDRKADKQKIKEVFEKAFEVKVEKINILIDTQGQKKAFIKLKPEFKAADVAVKLGII